MLPAAFRLSVGRQFDNTVSHVHTYMVDAIHPDRECVEKEHAFEFLARCFNIPVKERKSSFEASAE